MKLKRFLLRYYPPGRPGKGRALVNGRFTALFPCRVHFTAAAVDDPSILLFLQVLSWNTNRRGRYAPSPLTSWTCGLSERSPQSFTARWSYLSECVCVCRSDVAALVQEICAREPLVTSRKAEQLAALIKSEWRLQCPFPAALLLFICSFFLLCRAAG